MKFGVFLLLALVVAAVPVRAQQQVALELVLAMDVSESVNGAEYQLQSRGLAQAFRNPDVVAAIAGVGGIAVTVVQWGNARQQSISVPWTFITNSFTAEQVSNRISRSGRAFVGKGTAIADVLGYTSKVFAGSPFNGMRQVVDVSGDGLENRGGDVWAARDHLVEQGVTINGLAILNEEANLDLYYRKNVVGGPDAFVQSANRYEDYGQAIIIKLLREIGAPLISQGPARRSVPQG